MRLALVVLRQEAAFSIMSIKGFQGAAGRLLVFLTQTVLHHWFLKKARPFYIRQKMLV
jgi:hypothetical protein